MWSECGLSMAIWYSSCCFLMSLLCRAVHHGFLRGFGRFSCFSMVLCMECMICWNDSAVVLDGWIASVCVIVVLMSSRMVALFFWYLYVESTFVCFCFCLGGAVW